jgi:hypothetical protein
MRTEMDIEDWIADNQDQALSIIAAALDNESERIKIPTAKRLKSTLATQTRLLRAAIIGAEALGNSA